MKLHRNFALVLGTLSMKALADQARLISSGTIASLIGDSRYTRIDDEQARFVEFCEMISDTSIKTWQEAWGFWWVA